MVPLGVGDPHSAGAGAVNVALNVHLHPIRRAVVVVEKVGEEPPIADGAVVQRVKHPDVTASRVVDVQQGLVRRKAESIAVDKIVHQQGQATVAQVQFIDRLVVHVLLNVLALHPHVADSVGRVGEINDPVRLHNDVVGGVELLAVNVGGQYRGGAVMFPPPDGTAAPTGHQQTAFMVISHPVGLSGRVHDDAGSLARHPLPDFVVDDVGPDQKVFLAVPHRAFGKDVAAGNFFQGGVRLYDTAESRGEHLRGHCFLLAPAV